MDFAFLWNFHLHFYGFSFATFGIFILQQTNKMLQYIVSHSPKEFNYTSEQIIELLDCAISIMSKPYFLLHVKGQYLMENKNDYLNAIKCFDKCIRDNENKEYALHSAAMAHLYLAKKTDTGEGTRIIEIKKAKELLNIGLDIYESNIFFYKAYAQVMDFKTNFIINKSIIEEVNIVFNKYKKLNDNDDEITNLFEKILTKK